MLNDITDILHIAQGAPESVSQRPKTRRIKLLNAISEKHSDKKGMVVLFAPIELGHEKFLQDSNFYYFSDIAEPATVLTFGVHEPTTLYEPDFGSVRAQWVHTVNGISEQTKINFGIDELKKSGQLIHGYSVDPYFAPAHYQYVIELLADLIAQKQHIFTVYPQHGRASFATKMIIDRLVLFVPGLHEWIVDISDLIVPLRRAKDLYEIEQLYQAISITDSAFQAAAHALSPEATEAQIQASIEYIFTENHGQPAYNSIVAGGKNATILHYATNNAQLHQGELLLIDAGARFNHYCADITRVFPVSGAFSKEQKKLYEIVLEAQMEVASKVRPGMWLSNAQEPEMSLQHIAFNFLKQHGYEKYFPHSIGHFLGLDVHDIGSRSAQLQVGDVITIEPGIYIPEKSIGIRIEDNYWLAADGQLVCLSEEIPKTVTAIEEMVSQKF